MRRLWWFAKLKLADLLFALAARVQPEHRYRTQERPDGKTQIWREPLR